MLIRRIVTFVVFAAALTGCGNTTQTPSTTAAAPAPTTTTASTSNDNTTTTTTPTTTTVAAAPPTTTRTIVVDQPRSTELTVTPNLGKPGEPLTICGYLGPDRTAYIGLSTTVNEDSWPTDDSHHVATNDDGTFCWEGIIPTHLEHAFGEDANTLYPTPPGRYIIWAEHNEHTFAEATLDIEDT